MFNSNKELNSQKYLKFTLCLIATAEFGNSNSVLLMKILGCRDPRYKHENQDEFSRLRNQFHKVKMIFLL